MIVVILKQILGKIKHLNPTDADGAAGLEYLYQDAPKTVGGDVNQKWPEEK